MAIILLRLVLVVGSVLGNYGNVFAKASRRLADRFSTVLVFRCPGTFSSASEELDLRVARLASRIDE
jgi:hypothetical protein